MHPKVVLHVMVHIPFSIYMVELLEKNSASLQNFIQVNITMNCLSIYIKLVGVFLEFSNRVDFASISTPVLTNVMWLQHPTTLELSEHVQYHPLISSLV